MKKSSESLKDWNEKSSPIQATLRHAQRREIVVLAFQTGMRNIRNQARRQGDQVMRMLWFILALIAALACAPVEAATITITGTVTDSSGGSAPFGPITVTTDLITITSVGVVPLVAPAGTVRTLTVVGTSSAGQALIGAVNAVSGITFTPVTGQPAGTFKWTFVF